MLHSSIDHWKVVSIFFQEACDQPENVKALINVYMLHTLSIDFVGLFKKYYADIPMQHFPYV